MSCNNSQQNLEAFKAYAKREFGLSFSEIFDNLKVHDPEFGDLARAHCQSSGTADPVLLRIITDLGRVQDDGTAFSALGPTAVVVGKHGKKGNFLIWGIIGAGLLVLVAFLYLKTRD